jgi:hypothetical protein
MPGEQLRATDARADLLLRASAGVSLIDAMALHKQKGQSSVDDRPFDLGLRSPLRPSAFQKRFQFPRPGRMAEFAERLRFDLAYAFARDGEVLADLFERVLAAVRSMAAAQLDGISLQGAVAIS